MREDHLHPASRRSEPDSGRCTLSPDHAITAFSEGPRTIRLAFRGELDRSSAPALRSSIRAAAAGATWIVLDLSKVSFLDATGLGVIVAARRRTRAEGKELVLTAPSRPVRRVLELAGIHDLVGKAMGEERRVGV